jgi:hypothetical protein
VRDEHGCARVCVCVCVCVCVWCGVVHAIFAQISKHTSASDSVCIARTHTNGNHLHRITCVHIAPSEPVFIPFADSIDQSQPCCETHSAHSSRNTLPRRHSIHRHPAVIQRGMHRRTRTRVGEQSSTADERRRSQRERRIEQRSQVSIHTPTTLRGYLARTMSPFHHRLHP